MADLTKEDILYICVTVLGAAWLILAIFMLYIFIQQRKIAKALEKAIPNALGNVRVQRAVLRPESAFAYRNPTIIPDEELYKRGFSMYKERDRDIENQSQNSGPVFVEDLPQNNGPQRGRSTKRQQSEQHPPPFLIQGIESNKNRNTINPAATRGRSKSSNDMNFIY